MKKLIAFAIAMMLLVGAAHAATTADAIASITLDAGEFSIAVKAGQTTIDFDNVALGDIGNGHEYQSTANPTFVITNLDGTGAAFEVELQADRVLYDDLNSHSLVELDYEGTPTLTMTEGMATTGIDLITMADNDGMNTARKFVDADAGEGMGVYELSSAATAFELDLVPGHYAGTYTATVTATILKQ